MRTGRARTSDRIERDTAVEARGRPVPAGRIPAEERRALAIRQSLRWAERAAREGDDERARSWLAMVAPPTSARPGRSAPPSRDD